MKHVRHVFLQITLFLCFTNAYSLESSTLATSFKSLNSIFMLSSAQDAQAAKIISEALIKHDNSTERYQSIIAMLEKASLNRQSVINDLKFKSHSFSKLTDDNLIEMNFIDLRLMDAVFMLEAVTQSPLLTLDFIQKMSSIAVNAANGTHSSSELAALNMEFQAYKRAINYAQMITLFNGPKIINGGDITIRFGSDKSASSSLVIKIPAFDIKTLEISDLDTMTNANAAYAVNALRNAIPKLEKSIVSTSLPYITDGEAMLLNMPYMLYQNFMLDLTAQDLMIQALNGTTSDNDRSYMDMEFDWIKVAMNKTQTYLSLSGAKMTGGGNINIQIGKEPSPYTTLEIDLPATEIKTIGMDKLDIKTYSSSQKSFAALLKIMRDFTYYPSTNLKTR